MKKLFFFLLTAVCAMFYAPTADAVINSMRLVGTYNSQSLTLTLTPLNSAGTIWRWIGTNNDIKPSWTRTYQYQLEVDKDDDTTENWYYSSSGYSFSSGNEYSADGSWAVTTGNNYFTFNVTYSLINTTNYSVTVILSADKQSIAALRFEEYTAPVANVFMPLSRRDFDAGPRYFLVGTRTSDWRLQPEWEMTVNADRTEAALQPGRLMYKQLFGIAKVDCYDDYIMHRYTLYSCKGASVTSPNQSFDLEYIGLDQATRYKVTSTFHNDRYTTGKTDNYMKWCSDGTSWTSDDWIEAKPALITSAIITLDSGGNPVKVTFEYDTSENTIAKHRSFTLVGEDIKYDGQYSFSDDNKSDLYEMTHVYDSGKNTTVAWGNSWIQSNAGGVPYVDGWGHLLFTTAFDATWMSQHNTVFRNGEKNLTYNSASLTFIPAEQLPDLENDEYADLYKMHPGTTIDGLTIGDDQIGGGVRPKSGEFEYTEIMWKNGVEVADGLTNSNWQCMVVKDMWLSGPFKIWAGWGGHLRMGNNVDNNNILPQWFHQNGGHGLASRDLNIDGHDALDNEDATVYATDLDVAGANFAIDGMRYFPRVILWYDPKKGFESSVLQLVAASVGPEIQAFYNADKPNTLSYRWWVAAQSEEYDGDSVTGYTVYRYKTGADGVEAFDKVVQRVVFETPKTVGEMRILNTESVDTKPDRVYSFTDDSEALAAGSQYRYAVALTVAYEDGSGTRVKTARSNRLAIYAPGSPVIADAVQQTEKGADGETLYSFNIEFNARLSDRYKDETVNQTNPAVSVSQAAEKYIVTVDDATYTRLAKAQSLTIGGTKQDSPDIFLTAGTNEVQTGSGEYLSAGTRYFTSDAPKSTGDPLPAYVWHNVAPTTDGHSGALNNNDGSAIKAPAYGFTVYLMCSDELIDEWATMNFTSNTVSTQIVAPCSVLTVGDTGLRKTEGAYMSETSAKLQVAGTRGIEYAKNSDGADEIKYNPADPVVYTRLNESYAGVEFDAIPVTQEVLDNHSVEYTVYVTKAGATLAEAISADAGATVSIPDANKAKSADITSLDLSECETETDVDGIGAYIKGDGAMTFDTHLRVAYIPKWEGAPQAAYHNDFDDTDKGVEINLQIGQPTAAVNQVKMVKYRDQYWNRTDEETGAGVMEYPGYFAHGIVELDLGGIDNNSLNAYVGFHAPQKHVLNGHGTCYQVPDDTHYPDMYKFSFCGTRAANGGHPMNEGWSSDWNIAPIKGYEDYNTNSGDWDSDKHDWSTKAVAEGRLPLHINPIYDFGNETNYNSNAIDGALDMQVSVIYPVVKSDGITLTLAGAEAREKSPAARAATVVSDVYLVGRKSEPVTATLSSSQVFTGVEDVLGDADDAEPEYYNLQGIRVDNPVKGQVYIVRRGANVTKVLYK